MSEQTFDPNAEVEIDYSDEAIKAAGNQIAVDASIGNPDVAFLKEGTHTLKLRLLPGARDLASFYVKYVNMFEGKPFDYFLIPAIVIKSNQEGIEAPDRVKYVKVPKSAMNAIRENLGAGWRLFDVKGIPFQIRIFKEGKQTKYSFTVLQKTFDSSKVTWPEQSIQEVATQLEAQSESFDNKQQTTKPTGPSPEAVAALAALAPTVAVKSPDEEEDWG